MSVTEQQLERLQKRVRALEEKLASVFLPDGTIVLSSPQKVRIAVGSTRITLEETGITIESPYGVEFNAVQVTFNSTTTTFNSGMVTASGAMRCGTLIATSVVASSYTPGAGNVW